MKICFALVSHKWHRGVLSPTGESVDAPWLLALLLIPALLLRGDLRVNPLVVRHVGSGPGGARPCNTVQYSNVQYTTESYIRQLSSAWPLTSRQRFPGQQPGLHVEVVAVDVLLHLLRLALQHLRLNTSIKSTIFSLISLL